MPLQAGEEVVVVDLMEAAEGSMVAPEPSMVAQVECVVAGKDFKAAPGVSTEAKDSDAATDLDGACMETRCSASSAQDCSLTRRSITTMIRFWVLMIPTVSLT